MAKTKLSPSKLMHNDTYNTWVEGEATPRNDDTDQTLHKTMQRSIFVSTPFIKKKKFLFSITYNPLLVQNLGLYAICR